jgi:hypothetical protein
MTGSEERNLVGKRKGGVAELLAGSAGLLALG